MRLITSVGATVSRGTFHLTVFLVLLASLAFSSAESLPLAGVPVHDDGIGTNPAVAVAPDGRGVVVWQRGLSGNGADVFARLIDPAGVPVGPEIPLQADAAGAQTDACVSMAANGNFIGTWLHRADSGATSVRGRVFAADGAPITGEIVISPGSESREPDLAADAAGNFVAVWSEGSSIHNSLYARRFLADGTAAGSAFLVPDAAGGGNGNPSIAMAPDGRFAVSWKFMNGTRARLFRADGQAVTSPLVIASTGANASVIMDPAGSFVVAWTQLTAEGTVPLKVRAYGPTGEFVGEETVAPHAGSPQLALYPGSGFLVCWSEADRLMARAYPIHLGSEGQDFRLTGGNEDYWFGRTPKCIAIDGRGMALAAWVRPITTLSFSPSVRAGQFMVPSWHVATGGAFDVDWYGARLQGIARARTGTLQVWFEYGLTTNYGWSSPKVNVTSTSPVPLSHMTERQKTHALHHYRLVGQDANGIIYGEDRVLQFLNRPPVAQDYEIHPRSSLSVPPYATDPDGDSLTIVSVTNGQFGTVEIVSGEEMIYHPGPDYNGNDAFQYTISDGYGGTATATVILKNSLPVVPQEKSFHAPIVGEPLEVFDVLTEYSDLDNNDYGFSHQEMHASGTVDSTFTSTDWNYHFTSTGIVGDAVLLLEWWEHFGAKGTIRITLSNAAPQAQPGKIDTDGSAQVLNLLTFASDSDGDALVVTSGQGQFGTVALNGGEATYTPGPAFEGHDSFQYTVSDQRGGLATGTIAVVGTAITKRMLATRGQTFEITEEGNAVEASWVSFGIPSVMGDKLGWRARARTAGGEFTGIFTGDPATPVLRLRAGDLAPGLDLPPASQAPRFASFQEPVFGQNAFAVAATISGPGTRAAANLGVWCGDATGVLLIALKGSPAPGTDGIFHAFTSLVMNDDDEVFLVARLRGISGARIGAINNTGLWHWSAGSGLQLVLRSDSAVSLSATESKVVRDFQALTLVPGSPGEGRYSTTVAARIRFVDGAQALAKVGPNGVTIEEISGGLAAGEAQSYGIPDEISPDGGFVAAAALAAPLPGKPKRSVQALIHMRLDAPVAEIGSPAPGADGAQFRAFRAPIGGLGIDGAEIAAFIGTTSGPAAKNSGIWTWSDGSLALLARAGSEAPETNGARFTKFLSVAILPRFGPAFVASVTTTKKTSHPKVSRGLWATDAGGTLRLIAREGDVAQVGQATKRLRKIDVLGAVSGSPGQRRAFGEDAQIVYRAIYSDGASGIIRVTLPNP